MKRKMCLATMLPALIERAPEIAERIKELFPEPDTVLVRRSAVTYEAKDHDDTDRSLTAMFSTRHLDRDNEILLPKGADLSEYKLSPVILENHDYHRSAVGKAISVKRTAMGIHGKVQFAPHEAIGKERPDYFALSKFMPLTFSVGFIPREAMAPSDKGWGDMVAKMGAEWDEFGKGEANRLERIHSKWLVLENSVVPVPANIHARQDVKSKAAKAFDLGLLKESEYQAALASIGMPEREVTIIKPEIKAAPKPAPTPEPQPAVVVAQPVTVVKGARVISLPQADLTQLIAEQVKNELALLTGKV